MSKIRVAIPNYNYGRFLPMCVESVLGQADVDVEVLVIDDASADDSQAIANELAARDSRVEVRCHTANRGHIRTFNEGLEWTTEVRYGVLLSADDGLAPGALRRAQDLLDAHSEVGFVYGRPMQFTGDGRFPHVETVPARWRTWPGQEWFAHRWLHAYNGIVCPEVVMRTSVMREVGYWREELPHTADFEYWMRLSLFADVGHIAGPHQAYYRVHERAMHLTVFSASSDDISQCKKAYEFVMRDYAGRIANLPRLRKVAMRKLARKALDDIIPLFDQTPLPCNEVDKLQALAMECDEKTPGLWEWHFLRCRKAFGPRWGSIGLPLRALRSCRNRWARFLGQRRYAAGW